ncbi:MAG: polysaccharide biosynthesis C-terminal domain-containing protein [SAR324 cluster bacterium]|nr:polysaccharide biosynthesis C-terminal domain-containing protein [SAR324 cluster bacterium]
MQSLKNNLSWGIVGQTIAKGEIFVYHLLLPFILGQYGYGVFALHWSIGLMIVQPALELGLSQLVAKWTGRGCLSVKILAIRYQKIVGSILLPAVFIIGYFLGSDPILIFFLCLHFLSNSVQQVLFGVYRGMEDLRRESVVLPVQNLLSLSLLSVAWSIDLTEPWVAAAGIAIPRLIGLIWLFLEANKIKSIDIKNDEINFQVLLKEAWTLGMVLILIQMYFRIDTAMIGYLVDEGEVALYNAAFVIVEGSFFLPSLITAALIGSLSQTDRFLSSFQKGIKILSISGLVLGVLVSFLSVWFFNNFYPSEFSKAGNLLQLLSWAIPLVYLGTLMTQSLVALDKQKIYLFLTFCGLLINIILNLIWIPEFGATGAVWSTLITESFVPIACGVVIFQELKKKINSKHL